MRSSSERETSPSSSATPPRPFRQRLERWGATRWGGAGTAFATILAGAAVLRAVGIQYGLPFGSILNPDEQSIVPRAWKLVHGGGGDPHWFNYPTLLMYVNAPFPAWQHEPSYLTARLGGIASSPFVLVHRHQAWHEARSVQQLARDGWLGFEHDHSAPIAFVARLWDGLGPVLIICALGLAVALVRRTRTDLILAAFVIAYFVDLLTLRAHFDRYVLPLVPPLGALAGRFRALAPVVLLLLVVPLTWSARDDARLTRTDTRVVAYRWIVAHLPEDSGVAADSSTPPLVGYPVLPLQLPGPGRPSDPNRDLARLRARGIAYAVVTGAIADRVLATRERYPREARFHEDLRIRAKRIYY